MTSFLDTSFDSATSILIRILVNFSIGKLWGGITLLLPPIKMAIRVQGAGTRLFRSLNTRADGPPHPQSYRYDVGAGLIHKVLIFSATCQYIGLNGWRLYS